MTSGDKVPRGSVSEGHSVWPMSERRSALPHHEPVADAMRDFHQPHDETGLLPRHEGTWHDSLALTHCLCFASAWRMLDWLLDHPDVYERLRGEGTT